MSLDRHRISSDIYGVNFVDTATAGTLGITVDRWGGNSTTRYDYQTGFHNTGSDWYFENIPPDSGARGRAHAEEALPVVATLGGCQGCSTPDHGDLRHSHSAGTGKSPR